MVTVITLGGGLPFCHSIRKILTNAVTLAPIVVGITQADGWLVPGIAVGLGIAAIVLHAGLSVRRFRYQLLDGRLRFVRAFLKLRRSI